MVGGRRIIWLVGSSVPVQIRGGLGCVIWSLKIVSLGKNGKLLWWVGCFRNLIWNLVPLA